MLSAFDAAVDFDEDRQFTLINQFSDLFDLGQHVGNESLAAEAGKHGHHQHHVDVGKQPLPFLEERRDSRRSKPWRRARGSF